MRLDRLLNFMFRTGRGISVMLFSVLAGAVLAGGCSLSYDTSVGYIVDAYYIDETTGEVVGQKDVDISTREENTFLDPVHKDLDGYFTFHEYYGTYENGTFSDPLTDEEGNVLSDKELQKYHQKIYVRCSELYVGQEYELNFRAYEYAEGGKLYDLDADIPPITVTVGEPIGPLPQIPEIEGFHFLYWDRNGNRYLNNVTEDSIFHLYAGEFDPDSRTQSVRAEYERNEYKILFKAEDKEFTITVKYGDTYGEVLELFDQQYPTVLTETSRHRFDYWTTGGEQVDVQQKVTAAFSLEAVFTYKYKLIFHYTQGGEQDAVQETILYEGDWMQTPAMEDIGRQEFKGWFADAGYTEEFKGGSISQDTDVYAKWIVRDEYNLYYYLNEGDDVPYLLMTYPYSETQETQLVTLTDPTAIPAGYSFDGWCRQSDLSDASVSSLPAGIYGDIDLYANFLPNQYTVMLNAGGGSLTENKVTLTFGENFTLPVPVREGYTFGGWFLIDGTQITDGEGKSLSEFGEKMLGFVSSGSIQLVARWTSGNSSSARQAAGLQPVSEQAAMPVKKKIG